MLWKEYGFGDTTVVAFSMQARWRRTYSLYRKHIPADSWSGIYYKKSDFLTGLLQEGRRDNVKSQIEADIVLDVLRWWQKLRDVHLTADLDNSSVRRWLRSVSYRVDEAWLRYNNRNRKPWPRKPRRRDEVTNVKPVAV